MALPHSGFVNLCRRIYGHVIQGGGRGKGRAVAIAHGHRTLSRPTPSRIVRQLLTFVKVRSGTPKTEAVWGTRRATFYGPDRKGKSPTVNTPEALPAILGGGARAFRSIPIAACSDED